MKKSVVGRDDRKEAEWHNIYLGGFGGHLCILGWRGALRRH